MTSDKKVQIFKSALFLAASIFFCRMRNYIWYSWMANLSLAWREELYPTMQRLVQLFPYSFVGLGLFFVFAKHLFPSFATFPCPVGEPGMAFSIKWTPGLSSPECRCFW